MPNIDYEIQRVGPDGYPETHSLNLTFATDHFQTDDGDWDTATELLSATRYPSNTPFDLTPEEWEDAEAFCADNLDRAS